jgi:Domain of unknown function (DUF4153)
MTSNGARSREALVFAARVLTAIIQADALYALTEAAVQPRSWPATEPQFFVPLLLISAYIPLLVLLGLGQIRARPLATWIAFATMIIAGLGYHGAGRGEVSSYTAEEIFWPSYRLWLALGAGLFIAHVLVVDSIVERRFVPSYARHFETAWKKGVQVAFAAAFVGVLWGVLYLGAGLFNLVDIDFFERLIEHRWFAYPATTLALAMAVHVTDVQPSLIRGIRVVALALLSWLLPVLAAILVGFLGVLPFISLAPLWKTHFATGLLLIAAGFLVLLINSCYQDGAAEQANARIKRLAGTIGAVELTPVVGLAAWALWLRVAQYGWTVDRILAAAVIVVAGCYAVGYMSAAVRAPIWLKRIEITNFAAAYVSLTLMLALLSPLADPARLMVANQLARLKSGAVAPERFDFAALKFDGARWGAAALAELSQTKDGPAAVMISARAARALASTNRYVASLATHAPPTAAELAHRVVVYPEGRILPPSFYDASYWLGTEHRFPICFEATGVKCSARYVSLRPGEAEVILFLDGENTSVFERDVTGQWRKTAQLSGEIYCGGVRQALEQGDLELEPHTWPDLVVGGQRLTIVPSRRGCRS